MFDLEITPEERRSPGQLPERIREAVLAFLFDTLTKEPARAGKPLVGEFGGLYSPRRAEYRVIYEIDVDRSVVVILRVAHRGHAYRPR